MAKVIKLEDHLRAKKRPQGHSAKKQDASDPPATHSGAVKKKMHLVVNTPDGEVPLLDFLKSLPPGTKIKFGDTERTIE